jgi:hypothetical protein
VSQTQPKPGLDILVLAAWKSILTGSAPMMSIVLGDETVGFEVVGPRCSYFGPMDAK